jgi:hypothetical protein
MYSVFKILKTIKILVLVVMILSMVLGSNLMIFLPVEAAKLSGLTRPINGDTISGDYNFRVDDQGGGSRCELYIDGILVGYMFTGTGGWEWQYTVSTYAWSDGWHVIRFDSIGGTGGNDSKSIVAKFDNNPPSVTNVNTLYPKGQTASKPGDTVTIVATVTETTSGIASVICDTSFISTTDFLVMYDDGNHFDGLSGDDIYGTPSITITNEIIGYHPVYINATDGAGNFKEYPGEVGIDTIDPSIEDVNVVYPKGQFSAKDGDQVRVTAFIDDEDPDVDIVLDIDRSGSMGWTEDNKWMFQDIDISGIADNQNSLTIRFSYETDDSYRFSGWNIDDLKLVSDERPSGFFNANFENTSGDNSWTISGGEWELSVSPWGNGGATGNPDPNVAIEGSFIAGVDAATMDGDYQHNTGPHYITSPTINAAGQNNVRLTYYRWLNCDFPGTAPDYNPWSTSGDEHTIEINNNTGWTPVWDNKQQKLLDAKIASKVLVNHQGANDRSALYSFGNRGISFTPEVKKELDWTSNKTMMLNAIDNLSAFGSTPLWRSIVQAASYAGTSETIKALIVLTDGANTDFTTSVTDAIRAVRLNEVPTFTIALGTSSTAADLKAVSNAYPGGSYYFAASSDQLDDIYEDISQAIENIRFPKGAVVTYVNATNLGGMPKVLMYDDGFHDDFLADDDIYGSELITIATNGASGKIPFEVNVEDVAGRIDKRTGFVLVDNSVISISNSTVFYPDNKTNVRDSEDIWIVANITDPHGVFPPQAPNGIADVYIDALSIGAASHIDMFDDGAHYDNASDDGLFGSEPITVTTGFAIGTFIVMIHARDNASNTASQQLNVKVDNSGPTSCNLIWPIDNLTLEGTVKFLAGAFDDAGINKVELEIAGNDVWDKMTFNDNIGNYEMYLDTKTLSDGGPYKVKVRAYDNSGEAPAYDSLSFGFFVDNTEPVLTINAPRNGDYITGNFELNISYSDPGLFKPTVEYKIDDTEWLGLSSGLSGYWTALWDTSTELDGPHSIYFRANDTIGNDVQYSVQVIVDNNPPTCSIATPVENEYVQDKYTFKILASDDVGIKSVTITFMDENHTALYNPQTGYYEYTIDTILIEEGARTIDAASEDLMGRVTTAEQIIFHIDNSAPRMTINYPAPGSYVTGEIFIDVTSSDVYIAITEYKIDGTKWISTAVPWDTTKVLDGVHTIDIRSYDLLLHETKETIFVTVDNTEPTIEIHAPSFNQFLEGTYTFKVRSLDTIGIDKVELILFNQTVFATFNTQTNYYEFTFSSRLYDDGSYDVKATAYDFSGKSKSTGTIQFQIDNYDPELVLVSPASGDIISGDLIIEVLAHDTFLESVEYKIDKGGYVDINVIWDSGTLSDGEHTITVRAMDQAGHETTLEFPITVDNNPPEMAFVSPKPTIDYSGFMNIRISAFDSVGMDKVHIRLDDSKDPTEIFKSPETGLYETSINTEDLSDGEHTVYADVYDNNKFVTSKKINFYTDNTGPDIDVVSPGELDFGEIIFKFNVTDINGVKMVLLNIDSSGWREITLAQLTELESTDDPGEVIEVYSFNYIWSTTPEDNGRHFYVVKAIDSLDNEEIVTQEIMIDNVVKKVVKEPNYIQMINELLPLIVFITAIVLIIIVIFLFNRGTLQRLYSDGLRRAESGPGRKRPRIKKKVRRKDFDDEEFGDTDMDEEEPDLDQDYNFAPPGMAGRKLKKPGPSPGRRRTIRRMPRRPEDGSHTPSKHPKVKRRGRYSDEGDDEDITWD